MGPRLRGGATGVDPRPCRSGRAFAMRAASRGHPNLSLAPQPVLVPNTYPYESGPMVKATGFREYDARWLFGTEINLMGIQALGLGLGTLIAELGVEPKLVTGHDYPSG